MIEIIKWKAVKVYIKNRLEAIEEEIEFAESIDDRGMWNGLNKERSTLEEIEKIVR